MIAEFQQPLDLGGAFREPGAVPLVIEGQCYGLFVNPELREQSRRVLEQRSAFPVTGLKSSLRPKWRTGGVA